MNCNLSPKEYTKRARIAKAVKWGVALLLLIALATVNYFFPLRSLLPAHPVSAREEGELRLHFLDVGQADCTVVEFPNGELLVVDAGDGSWQSRGKIISYMKGLNAASAPSIRYVVTHADGDHYGGMEELISLFGGTRLYLPVVQSANGDYASMIACAQTEGLQIDVLTRYDVIASDAGGYLTCLSPRPAEEGESNELSAVLYLNYRGKRALLCGDTSSERERLLLAEYRTDESFFDVGGYEVRLEDLDVLKVAHHGSAYSSCDEWLGLLKAKHAVISCGQGNAYSHPSARTVAALKGARDDCELYRTDELGNVVVVFCQDEISVEYDGLE